MSAEAHDNMCKEIVENSKGVWDDALEGTEDGILLDELWKIVDKYIERHTDARQDSINTIVNEIVIDAKRLAKEGIDRNIYTIPKYIRNSVLDELEKHGITRLALSKIHCNETECNYKLTW